MCFSTLTYIDFFKDLLLRSKKNTMRQTVEESEQSVMKQHESTDAQEPNSACSLSGIKTRQAATFACAHCWARHQYKHHRNKIIQQAFRDLGRSPIFSVPYLELVLLLLSITAPWRSHVFMWHNEESQNVRYKLHIYTFNALCRKMMWDLQICHTILLLFRNVQLMLNLAQGDCYLI